MLIFDSVDDLVNASDPSLGSSAWHEITQADVSAFADVTRDQQWIHVDEERAAEGVYGRTVVHGYFALSLIPFLASQLYVVKGADPIINYGLDRVRFPAPIMVGTRVRLTGLLLDSSRKGERGTLVRVEYVLERENESVPGMVAVSLRLLVGS